MFPGAFNHTKDCRADAQPAKHLNCHSRCINYMVERSTYRVGQTKCKSSYNEPMMHAILCRSAPVPVLLAGFMVQMVQVRILHANLIFVMLCTTTLCSFIQSTPAEPFYSFGSSSRDVLLNIHHFPLNF
jgi:hypothetical protein